MSLWHALEQLLPSLCGLLCGLVGVHIAVIGRSGGICCTYSVPSLVVLPLSWIVVSSPSYSQIFLFQIWPVLVTWNDLEQHRNFKTKYALYSIQFHMLWNGYKTYVACSLSSVHIRVLMCLILVRFRQRYFPTRCQLTRRDIIQTNEQRKYNLYGL
jgi:hypothetical protein